MNLADWKGVSSPARAPLEGRYVRLERWTLNGMPYSCFSLQAPREQKTAFAICSNTCLTARQHSTSGWKRLPQAPIRCFRVIDKRSGRAEGRQALMRIDTVHGVIEIGNILWGPAIARSRIATEALYLFASLAFDMGYRRFEWKCNNENEPSKRAAARFGFTFEGVFRQHLVVKGKNRDTAWFSITDAEWPHLKAGYEAWLKPENFDADGRQLSRLTFSRENS